MTTTRRAFLRTSLLGTAAGFASTAAFAQPTQKTQKWDETYDVVIVGGGAGGMSAACWVARAGLKAVVIEKMPIYGGSSVLCGGSFTLSETKFQKEKGIPDTDKKFYDDMIRVGGGKNIPELVKTYIEAAKTQYAFITEELGVKPYTIVAGAGMSEPRAHMFKPDEVVKAMHDDATAKGVKVMLRTAVERLVWDAQTNRISGVRAVRGKKTIFVGATKGVILASGGFSRSKALLEKYNPLMARADAEGGLQNTGDGLLMAQAYGADVLDTNYIKATHGYRPSDPKYKRTSHTYYYGGILVDKGGKRFVDESLSYKLLGDESLKLENGTSYAVFDETTRQALMKDLPKDKNYLAELEGGKDTTWCMQAPTLEGVAKKAGLDVEGLKATVAKYNKDCATGKDSVFGRTSLTSGFGKIRPIEKAPFYVYPVKPRLIATYCGVKIDTTARVIDVFGDPIPGLYACGEVTGGLHGAAYMSGTAFGKAQTFGMVAAKAIAKK